MTIYARSDINYVQVADAGHSHVRPFVQGLKTADPIFDKDFAITCAYCEDILLREKDCYARRADSVPLTPDEQAEAKAEERTGNALISQMARQMALAGQEAVREMRIAKS